MSLLLIEDDEFKATDIMRIVTECVGPIAVRTASSVTGALRTLSVQEFDVVILDMALPTFDMSGPGGGGSPQGQGGIEILRLARRLRHQSIFIVVTQYPGVEIDGSEVSLGAAPRVLSAKFALPVKVCIKYEFDNDSWQSELRNTLRQCAVGRA